MPLKSQFRLAASAGRWLTGLILAVPFLVLVLALWFWSENIVYQDDYALLDFMIDWTDPAQSWGHKLQRLIEPRNFHRIVYDRLVTLGTYYLTGRVNFLAMIVLGNAALLGIVWRFWTLFRRTGLPALYFIPVPWWLLNLQSHENMFWGMASLQNFTVIWFMLEALHRLIRRNRIAGPLLLTIAALFTSGNGLLGVLVGSLVVGWQWRWRTDGWLWIAGIAGALAVFFWHYKTAPPAGTLLAAGPKFLMVLGASFTNQTRFGLAAVGGAVILTGVAVLLLAGYQNRSQRLRTRSQTDAFAELLAFGAIVAGTALILSISRPPDELLRDRYRIYSHLSLGLLYLVGLLLLAHRFRPVWAVVAGSVAIGMYVVSAYSKIPEILNLRQYRQVDAFNFRHYGTTLPPPSYAESTHKILQQTHGRDIFRHPFVWSDPARWQLLPVECRMTVEAFSDPNPIVYFARNNHYLRVRSSPAFLPGQGPLSSSTCLIAESSGGRRYTIPAALLLSTKADLLTKGHYFRDDRITEFQKAILPPGTYRLGLLFIQHDEVAGYVLSSESFTVAPTD
ncbi:MAG TPA: hypothetical protein VK364_11330 [Hymenobacter sp.]|nr:hypothetical protein [Hymenobacter sp.]